MEVKDDSSEGFYKLLKEDAEAYLEPTDFCLFEQPPPLWIFISKRGRNVGFQTLGDSSEPDKLEPVTPWFDADALNNIHTKRSSVSTYRSRPNNYIQQHGNSFTKQRDFRQWATGDLCTSLHLPKLPVVAPMISEKSQPIQVCSINSIPEHVPTVNVPEPVARQDVAPQEEPTSSQPIESEIGEHKEMNGPVVGETTLPQPSVRNSFSDRPMRIEDLQSSRRAIDMSIASNL
ncbi:hypothetical protein P9112_005762 [Eukaryota sp. TZLM1-RC]